MKIRIKILIFNFYFFSYKHHFNYLSIIIRMVEFTKHVDDSIVREALGVKNAPKSPGRSGTNL